MIEPSYSIPRDVLVAHLQGEAVILHTGTKRYYRLNDTAALIWKGLERHDTVTAIIDGLCKEFDVTPANARSEVERVLGDLENQGLLAQQPGT